VRTPKKRAPGRRPSRKSPGRKPRGTHGHRYGYSIAALVVLVAVATGLFLWRDYRAFSAGRSSRVFERLYPVEHFRAGQARLNTELVTLLRTEAGVRNTDVTERRVKARDAHGEYDRLHWRILWRGRPPLTEFARRIEQLQAKDGWTIRARRLESRQWGDYLYVELAIEGRISHSMLFTLETRREEPEQIVGAPTELQEAEKKVAIVIDDVGYNLPLTRSFLQIDAPLSFSILPFQPDSVESAMLIREAGHEALVHMPMEPRGYPDEDPGPGAILQSMDPEEVRAATLAAIDSLPLAVGLNNHMGSRITSDPILIGMVLRTLRERKMFFLDSRTTEKTVAHAMALRLRVRSAERDVFLDDIADPYYIGKMIDELFVTARRRGSAIGIGHLTPVTLEALRAHLWKSSHYGVRIRPISELVPP